MGILLRKCDDSRERFLLLLMHLHFLGILATSVMLSHKSVHTQTGLTVIYVYNQLEPFAFPLTKHEENIATHPAIVFPCSKKMLAQYAFRLHTPRLHATLGCGG
jgi:hypothetical protein